MTSEPASDVTVIGAGVVGVAAALELAGRGLSVTILERGEGPAAGCSAGNAGIVGASEVAPLAGPEALRDGLRLMWRRTGAFSLRPRPVAARWLASFLRASTAARYEAGAAVLAELGAESARLHRALADRHDTGFVQRGMLNVYESSRALAAAEAHPLPGSRVLDGAAARELCPQLRTTPAGAVFLPGDAHCDPERFVEALMAAASTLGVRLRTGVEVLGMHRANGRVASVLTSVGELRVEHIVLAAGAWTPGVAADLPVRVPVLGGKGYHLDYVPKSGDTPLPVYFPEQHVVVTPMGERLRLSGMLQLVGTDMRVDRRRVEVIEGHGRRLLSGLDGRRPTRVWRGLRPCTPDGLPLVGAVPGADNVMLATGHGMWGLQLAPVTARLVADALTGQPDERRLHPLRPERFGQRGRFVLRSTSTASVFTQPPPTGDRPSAAYPDDGQRRPRRAARAERA